MMTDTTDNPTKLLSPIRIGPYELPNRIVMAPMTRNRAGDEGVPTELNALYYAQRASAGLIISEASPISPQGVGYPGTPGIYTSAQVEGWKRVTDAIHEKGGRIFIQLWHVGRISHPSLQPGQSLPIAPSAIRPQGEAFTATGLQPFVTPRAGTNHREDEYGGSIENRCRLLMQVLEAVVNAWGSDYVGVRLSPLNPFNDISDSDPQALFSHLVTQLDKWKLAYLHMVEGTLQGMDLTDQSFDLTTLKSLINAPYMANGGYTRERAELAIDSARADLVSFGESYIANPDLVRRFELDSPLNEADPSTYYGGGSEGYTDYPALSDDAG
ncbi:MAG: alkene reductase [Candidatus Thiodiazotropha sp.]